MNKQPKQVESQFGDKKDFSKADIISMIEASLAAAFRKDYGEKNQNIVVEFNPENLSTKVFDVKTVVETPLEAEEDPQKFVDVEAAQELKKKAKVGDVI